MGLGSDKKFGDLLVGDDIESAVSLRTAAWEIHDIVHFQFDSPLRGEYDITPGVDGEQPNPLRASGIVVPQRFSMTGSVDHTGEPYEATEDWTAWAVGFASNMNYLRTHVLTGRTLTGDRTRLAHLVVPGEAEPRTARIHAWLSPGTVNNKNIWQGTLYVRVGAGMFLPPPVEP